MQAHPGSHELLTAMAKTLHEQVIHELDGTSQHAARVVANLCRILAREAELGLEAREQTRVELQAILSTDAPFPDLLRTLDEHLQSLPPDAEPDDRIIELMRADVERRLTIARPSYLI